MTPSGAGPASTSSPSPSRFLLATLAFLVVLLAGWLRFQAIDSTQIFRSDEGFYHLEARRLVAQVQACRKVFEIYRNERPAGLLRLDDARRHELEELVSRGYGQLGGRFLHDVLLAISLGVVGHVDWAGNAMSALFGLLTIVLVGLWARALLGDSAAVYAPALLTCSALHLVYSRTTLAETDLAFFVTLCLAIQSASLLSERHERALMFTAGLVFGLGFLTSLRTVPLAYAVVAGELASRRWRAVPGSLVAFGLGGLLPLVAAEAFFHVLFLFSAYSGVMLSRHSLAMNVVWLFFRFSGGVVNPGTSGLWLYPRFLAAIETPAFLVLGGVGLGLAAHRAFTRAGPDSAEASARQVAIRPLVIGFLVLGAYWQFAVSIKAVRYLSMVLPLAAVLGAFAMRAAERVLVRRFRPDVVAAGLLAAVLIASVPAAVRELPRGPSYREVALFLRAQGEPKIVATQVNVFRVWFEGERVVTAESYEALSKLHAVGYRFYVGCYQKYHHPTAPAVVLLEEALSRVPPVATFEHPRGNSWHTWIEGGVPDPDPVWASDANHIRVWDLDRVFAAEQEKAPPVYTPLNPH